MSKYSNDFKLEVVKYCIEENHSQNDAAQKFKIPSRTPIKEWIRKYKEHGPEGLIKHQKSSYDGEFKQYVVEYMRDNHISATETAVYFRLQAPVVLKWERIYYEEGPQRLFAERRGRPRKMSSKKNKKSVNENEDLLAEVQHLRMENEYLKKLNVLVQKRIKRENKKK